MKTGENIPNAATDPSLIAELKAGNSESWNRFYDTYSRIIVNFAQKHGCDTMQAEDVLQETVMALLRTIPNFDFNPAKGKFRSLLFKITESKVIDAFRRNKRNIPAEDPEVFAKYQGLENNINSPSSRLWDKTWENLILSEAIRMVKSKVQPLTFKCFEEAFMRGHKVKLIAEKLHISPNLVSQHKHKVYSLILKEAEILRTQS